MYVVHETMTDLILEISPGVMDFPDVKLNLLSSFRTLSCEVAS